MSQTVELAGWLPRSIFGFISALCNLYMLVQEIRKRRSENAKFSTALLKVSSFLCLLFGVFHGIFAMVNFVPIICHIASYIQNLMSWTQPITLGFYQLARLKFCFANTELYKQGYPNILFTIMYLWGILLIIIWIIALILLGQIYSKCGLFSDGSIYRGPYFPSFGSLEFDNIFYLYFILLFMVSSWDILTLILYIIKIISLGKTSNTSNTKSNKKMKIMQQLKKIVVLTLLYQVLLLIASVTIAIINVTDWYDKSDIKVIPSISSALVLIFPQIVCNYSLYLMLDHNESEYHAFRKRLRCLKLECTCIADDYKYRDDNDDMINDVNESTQNEIIEMEQLTSAPLMNTTNELDRTSTKYSQKDSKQQANAIGLVNEKKCCGCCL